MKCDITIIHIKSDWEHRQASHELIKILFPNFSQIYTTHLHFTQAGISPIILPCKGCQSLVKNDWTGRDL